MLIDRLRSLGQAHAEIELLKKAFAMTQKKVREGRIKPMQRDDLRPSMKPFMMAFRYCRVPKLFRTYLISELEVRNMKLNKRKIHGIIREKKKGLTTSEIARDMKISRRRVQQVWKQYLDTGIEPVIGKDISRPKKHFDSKEAQIVVLAYARYRFGHGCLR